jgi:hypothetical protein
MTAEIHGSIGQLQVLTVKETTWGSPLTVSKDLGRVTSATPTETRKIITSHGLGVRQPGSICTAEYDPKLSLKGEYVNGRPIAYALGNTWTESGTADPYTHTLKVQAATDLPIPFTCEISQNGTNDMVRTYAGCVIDKLSLSQTLGGMIEWNADILAKTVAYTTAASTASYNDSGPSFGPIWADIKVGTASTEVPISHPQSWSVDISNSCKQEHALKAAIPAAMSYGPQKYSGKFSCLFDDSTEYALFLGSAAAPLDTSMPAANGLVIDCKDTAVATRRLNLDFSNVYIESVGAPYELAGGAVKAEFAWQAKTLDTIICNDTQATLDS